MASLILDLMGGDHGPKTILEGVVQALPDLSGTPGELILLGDENIIRPLLAKRRFRALSAQIQKKIQKGKTESFQIRLVHAPETIEMADSIRAIRNKPNASINVGCELAAESYRSSKAGPESHPLAFISAGHSGAVMASALLSMGRLDHVERPAIAVQLPTLSEDGCVLVDVGANVDCKPEHLRDFAVMGALFAQVERKRKGLPRVGVLSNGEEAKKGNELTRAASALIQALPCFTKKDSPQSETGPSSQIGEYIGYCEGKEIFKGEADVVVTDGFVGNVVLKSVEGLGAAVISILKAEAKRSVMTSLGFLLSAGVFSRFKKRLDYAEYGAAPLLGVAGYVFICHGRSNPKAIKSALIRARSAVQSRCVERLEQALKDSRS